MKFNKLFHTPIANLKLPARTSSKLNQDLLYDINILKETDKEGLAWSKKNYVGGYTSYSSITDLHMRHSAFMDFKMIVDKGVKSFLKELEYDLQGRRVEMTSCWVNVMPANVYHSLHMHPLSLISGTYYVKVPKGSGEIKFEDPRMPLFMAAPPLISKPVKNTPRFFSIKPAQGQLLLWESWLRHEVAANQAQSERISVSFNYEWI